MKRLVLLVLIGFAAWYGWHHYGGLNRGPANEAVIENIADKPMFRVRLTADGQTQVREVIQPGDKAVLPFRVGRDSAFELHWEWRHGSEMRWTGGLVTAGPVTQRHRFQAMADGGVVWTTEKLVAPSK